MIKKVYIDTSVVGGQYDPEFEFWTKMFFEAVVNGEYQIIISELLIEELQLAPNHIRNSLDNVPKDQKVFVELSNEAYNLANLYIKNNIVGKMSISDCRHIATATVNEIEMLTRADILASWNFKHYHNDKKTQTWLKHHLKEAVNLFPGLK